MASAPSKSCGVVDRCGWPIAALGLAGVAAASFGLGVYYSQKKKSGCCKADAKDCKTDSNKASAAPTTAGSGGSSGKTTTAGPRIVVIGSVNADMFFDVQALPREGETISASVDPDYIKPGGKGANQAVAAQKLGANTRVSFIGRFGADAHGVWARQQMSELYGVDISHSTDASSGVPMGQAYIYVNRSGQNSIVLVPGANGSWPVTDPSAPALEAGGISPSQAEVIRSGSLLLLQREIPDRINLDAAKIGHSAGVRVCLDVGGYDTALPDSILKYLYLLAPNETELARITGLPTDTDTQITAAAHSLLKRVSSAVQCSAVQSKRSEI